jgi:hypothetical protein
MMVFFSINMDFALAYYNPEVGRFISRDPIGYEAEDVNLYRYVSNNSLNKKDPLGLAEIPWLPIPTPKIPSIPLPKIPPIIPNFPMLPSGSPECDKYPACYTYAGTNARCFCKCAGDSDWSQYVRGCLRHYYERGMGPTRAHARCYAYGTAKHGNPPWGTLIECVAECEQILPSVPPISIPSIIKLPPIPIPLPPIFDLPTPIPWS